MRKKRILFGASYSIIEPLGLLHLGGLARDMGWERDYHLVKSHNYEKFFERVRDFKPDVVGFNVYTGNHIQVHEAFARIKREFPGMRTVIGGPHATYFPSESMKFADFVVMSEGFKALQRILNEEATPGILPFIPPNQKNGESAFRFPQPDRERFYVLYPEHALSPIKSIIGMTGCPYACSYCYNSSKISDIAKNAPKNVVDEILSQIGERGRLFPNNVRSVDDVITEGRELSEKWPTEVVYYQDDVHGFDISKGGWMPQLADRWMNEVGIPYHAQMRWEMTKEDERLDLMKKAGCFGLTLAIEAADPNIRAEVLNRLMPTELMFDGMKKVIDRGMKVRTEQITGLPYGATSRPSPINLEADLQLVELNVELKRKTGGPTMAWASTLAPYQGTKMGGYCERFGHYRGNNSDVPDTFFDRSVMRFPKQWTGLQLEKIKEDPSVWLQGQALEDYRDKNAELRRLFNFLVEVPVGHKLAKNYLESPEPFSYERVGRDTEAHLRQVASLNGNSDAVKSRAILAKIEDLRAQFSALQSESCLTRDLLHLVPYFACLPKSELAINRAIQYTEGYTHEDDQVPKSKNGLAPMVLSTAVRRHLYEEELYNTRKGQLNGHKVKIEIPIRERYPAKV